MIEATDRCRPTQRRRSTRTLNDAACTQDTSTPDAEGTRASSAAPVPGAARLRFPLEAASQVVPATTSLMRRSVRVSCGRWTARRRRAGGPHRARRERRNQRRGEPPGPLFNLSSPQDRVARRWVRTSQEADGNEQEGRAMTRVSRFEVGAIRCVIDVAATGDGAMISDIDEAPRGGRSVLYSPIITTMRPTLGTNSRVST